MLTPCTAGRYGNIVLIVLIESCRNYLQIGISLLEALIEYWELNEISMNKDDEPMCLPYSCMLTRKSPHFRSQHS